MSFRKRKFQKKKKKKIIFFLKRVLLSTGLENVLETAAAFLVSALSITKYIIWNLNSSVLLA